MTAGTPMATTKDAAIEAQVAAAATAHEQPQTTQSGAPVSRYRWTIAALLVTSTWAFTVPSLSFGIMLPAITDDLHLSELQKGWMGSSLRIGNVLIAIPAALLLARVNPVRLSTLSLLLGAGCTFLMGLANGFIVFFIARLGFGLSFSLRTPARSVMAQQWFPVREISLLNGMTIGLSGVAEAATLALTPFILAATDSWRTTYVIFGFVCVAILATWVFFARHRSTPEFEAKLASRERAPLGPVLRNRTMWLVGVSTAATSLGWWVFAIFWPTFMKDEYGMSLKQSGFLFSLISIGTIPASLALGFYMTRGGHRRLILAVSGIVLAGASFGMMTTDHVGILAMMCVLAGLAWGHLPLATAIPYELPGLQPREVAVAVSMNSTMMMTGGVIGPILAGAINEWSGTEVAALAFGAACPLVMTAASPFIPERRAA